ncbi:MAG TPA: GDP-mannose 4,6-dehydratase [Rugosimonospora sp.]|nr:GDP-mannose 4,6-dehydratase [Rugosimonospora sp.]
MTTTLVTGSAGFVGGYLCRALRGRGDVVVDYDLRFGQDIRDYEKLRAAVDLHQPDLIFHLAAQAYVPEGTSDPRRVFDVNLTGSLNLLEAVRQTGSRARVLLAGTSEEYGYDHAEITEDAPCRPTTPYGVSKLAAGQLGLAYSRLYGIPVVVTRTFNHTGPGHPATYAIPAFAERVAKVEAGIRPAVEHGNLQAVRNYTDVRDIVDAYLLAIDLPSDVYNLCSEYTVSLQWVLDTLIGLARQPLETKLDGSLYRSGSPHFPSVSAEKFAAMTGWKPRIPLERTLADVLNYWRAML